MIFQGIFKTQTAPQAPAPIIIKMPLWQLAQEAGPFVRLAGLSGAAAVVLGAMGAHRNFPEPETKEDLKKIFETANRFHFLHTLALVTVPLCRRPYVVSILTFLNLAFLIMYSLDNKSFNVLREQRLDSLLIRMISIIIIKQE